MILQFDAMTQKAIQEMKSWKNIFLTGKAWTGKSTLLMHFLSIVKDQKNIVVLAPTGVAALNVWWQTIHAFCKFSITVTIKNAAKSGTKAHKQELYKHIDIIIIDEISMVRADMLDCLDIFLRKAKNNNKPFGWIQMILIGDLYQLPPIVRNAEKEFFETHYPSPYFFDAKVMHDNHFSIEMLELEKI